MNYVQKRVMILYRIHFLATKSKGLLHYEYFPSDLGLLHVRETVSLLGVCEITQGSSSVSSLDPDLGFQVPLFVSH